MKIQIADEPSVVFCNRFAFYPYSFVRDTNESVSIVDKLVKELNLSNKIG